mmetsp:Transcript_25003/g.35012  ORF Transcript_25003/g.35012 Transcript_25003/m.35012 type:complete len:456 (-) Transcript_25003:58-1425(-)
MQNYNQLLHPDNVDTPSPQYKLEPQSVKFPDRYYWRDWPFALLFILHLIAVGIIFAIALAVGPSDHIKTEVVPVTQIDEFKTFILIVLICAAVGIFFSFLYLVIIWKFAKQLIIGTIIANVISGILLMIHFFFAGSIGGGIMALFFTVFVAILFYLWRTRIPFASVILKTVVGVIECYPATVYLAFLSLLIILAWSLFWVITVACAQRLNSNGLLLFFLILSFYWTTQVIKNIVHVTVAGTFASWYFLSGTVGPAQNPTLNALKRATTTSLGSICFGSLIVAFLKTLRSILHAIRSQGDNCCACIFDCILSVLESLIQYFNVYAFTQVAIYGKTYCQAAKDTWILIKSHGVEAIINDNLISGVLFLGSFLGGIVSAIIGGIIAYSWIQDYWLALIIIGFVVGFAMVMLAMEVVESGVVSLFVCFAMDKDMLKLVDPVLYQKFMETYYELHQQSTV